MKVYMTKKQSDMTEGRGNMVNDACFLHKKDAENHINGKPGVQGRVKNWNEEKYGDWEIQEIHVYESSMELTIKRQKELIERAKSKLNDEEFDALVESLRKEMK